MATQDTDLAMVKCLKFLEQPRVDQLVQQLDLCTQIFEGLAAHPGWIEASYSYTEEQGAEREPLFCGFKDAVRMVSDI
eukprot:symbB.v1.2.034233.t1/scaffold4386.1/size40349/3